MSSSNCKSTACGLLVADFEAPRVCCESGDTISGYVRNDDEGQQQRDLCRGMPTETYCHTSDSMCASGFCINGTCAEEGLDANEQCSRDADCKSNACALGVADIEASPICCESGDTFYDYVHDDGSQHELKLCRGMPTGTYCQSSDSMCASGFCINETCAEEGLDNNATCVSSSNCKSTACGLLVADFEAPRVCCESGDTISGYVRNDDEGQQQRDLCRGMPTGTYCHI